MSYIALMRFADLQDGNYVYEAGDTYPRPGFTPSEKRIAELSGPNNRMGYALIEAAESREEPPKAEPEEIPDKPAKKRTRAAQKG